MTRQQTAIGVAITNGLAAAATSKVTCEGTASARTASKASAARRILQAWLLLVTCWLTPLAASPWLLPGDSLLRHDLQRLADAGLINVPLGTWPLSQDALRLALDRDFDDLSPDYLAALHRVRRAAHGSDYPGTWTAGVSLSAAAQPREVRGFEDTPREEFTAGGHLAWTGTRSRLRLAGQYAADPQDGRRWRADGSYLGLSLGNWTLAAAQVDQWWGPGWQGSLVLGSNARPVPALLLRRNLALPFESRWLRWIGPWDLAAFHGLLESDRAVPDARLTGLRIAFRPHRSLEVGLSRTLMWCGEGRPCGFDTLVDGILGRDNVGQNVSAEAEPGDQMAGFDLRWSTRLFGRPWAFYGQFIGEDATDYWPTLWLGQLGAETTGALGGGGSYRLYLEWADTECDFRLYRSLRGDDGPGRPGCAYRNALYQTGHRYRGRSLGHGIEADASVATLGLLLEDGGGRSLLMTLNAGNLNRRDGASLANSIAGVKTRYREAELRHRRPFLGGTLGLGLGYDYRRPAAPGPGEGGGGDWHLSADWRADW